MKAFYETGTGGSANAPAQINRRRLSGPRTIAPAPEETRGMREMKALLKLVVQFLVDRADKVEVRGIDGQQTTLLEVRVHKDDTCHVIGRQGRTLEALRTLLMAVAAKHRKRVMLDIIEGGGDV